MPQTQAAGQPSKPKIVYVDNIKVALTVLVILHHAFITYGAPGGWYYAEKTAKAAAVIPMTLFVAVNQSFFMGCFFLLSALFVPASYYKKGVLRFLSDRLLRFGVPLVFYAFILFPIMNFMVYRYAGKHPITFMQFLTGYDGWIQFGVLWFVWALLLFNIVYVLVVKLAGDKSLVFKAPSVPMMLLFAGVLSIITFLVRIIFPIGWTLQPFGFQLGHFSQYILLFVVGLIAANNNWLAQAEYKQGKLMAWFAVATIFIGFPAMYAIKVTLNNPTEWFNGGLHLEAAMYAFWEQFTGVAIIVALLFICKHTWNTQSKFMRSLSRSAFAVYILHPFVLISLSMLLINWQVDPVYKLLVLAPLGIIISFSLGGLVVRIPGVNRII
ncbi:acyltransferase [Mucilaginibacter achroorhodeus]|uniref:Acyltransferase n=1 Tax=Mucilaginibacter achroorhodeus TaxID=2599294 RepID=A0A563TYP2_9SPHI|nr:acyltransferase [Mucilaginibacter achroorhodeus]TWR24487.1 acyltransferase [Mucilaginibacter achroorhodeus]